MARNRQRAKQRRARREAQGAAVGPGATKSAASGGGVAPPEDEGTVKAAAAVEVRDEVEREVKKAQKQQRDSKAKAAAKPATAAPKQRGRFVSFLRSSWAELRRVQWPDRQQVSTLTGVVIGFVALAGVYLGVIDWVASQIVNQIIF